MKPKETPTREAERAKRREQCRRTPCATDITCIACDHFYFHAMVEDYSELTPGDDAGMECGLGHLHIDLHDEDFGDADLCRELEKAQTCADFKRRSRA